MVQKEGAVSQDCSAWWWWLKSYSVYPWRWTCFVPAGGKSPSPGRYFLMNTKVNDGTCLFMIRKPFCTLEHACVMYCMFLCCDEEACTVVHAGVIPRRLYVRCVPVLILHWPGGDKRFTSPFVMLDLLMKGLFVRLNSGLTTLGYVKQIGFPACHVSMIVTLFGRCLTLVWLNLKTSAS